MASTVSADFFLQNESEAIFRITRSPSVIKAHVLFLQGLFEELNINRHAFTQASITFSKNQIASTTFDYFGTGDSQGESRQATFKYWQNNILSQIACIKARGTEPIFIVAFGSAALLLDDDILLKVNGVQLWHPEVKGARFIKKMERLDLLNGNAALLKSKQYKEIAGYQVNNKLWSILKDRQYQLDAKNKSKVTWLECIEANDEVLSKNRIRDCELWVDSDKLLLIEQQKYWLSATLIVPDILIGYSLRLLLENINNE